MVQFRFLSAFAAAIVWIAAGTAFQAHAESGLELSVISSRPKSTRLPLPAADHEVNGTDTKRRRSAAYWTKALAGQDFSEPDSVDPVAFNRALWLGLKGDSVSRYERKER